MSAGDGEVESKTLKKRPKKSRKKPSTTADTEETLVRTAWTCNIS